MWPCKIALSSSLSLKPPSVQDPESLAKDISVIELTNTAPINLTRYVHYTLIRLYLTKGYQLWVRFKGSAW